MIKVSLKQSINKFCLHWPKITNLSQRALHSAEHSTLLFLNGWCRLEKCRQQKRKGRRNNRGWIPLTKQIKITHSSLYKQKAEFMSYRTDAFSVEHTPVLLCLVWPVAYGGSLLLMLLLDYVNIPLSRNCNLLLQWLLFSKSYTDSL